MKRTYLYISNTINSKKFYICFSSLICGLFLGFFTREESAFDSFSSNVTDLLSSGILIIFLYLSISINIFNIITDLKNYNIIIRLNRNKVKSFYAKEIAFATSYTFLIFLILLLAFSIFFCNGDYSFAESVLKLPIIVYDLFLLLILYIKCLLFSYIIFYTYCIIGKKYTILLIILITVIKLFVFFANINYLYANLLKSVFLTILDMNVYFPTFSTMLLSNILSLLFILFLLIILKFIYVKRGKINEISN